MYSIHPFPQTHREWLAEFLTDHWGSRMIVSKGRLFDASLNPAFAAVRDADMFGDAPVIGLVTYEIHGKACEITSLDSLQEGIGIGSALIDAVKTAARAAKCKKLWLITTNDNTHALRFYQKRGFRLCAVHVNALEASRKLKPQIPLTGIDGIPLRDEIELEMDL